VVHLESFPCFTLAWQFDDGFHVWFVFLFWGCAEFRVVFMGTSGMSAENRVLARGETLPEMRWRYHRRGKPGGNSFSFLDVAPAQARLSSGSMAAIKRFIYHIRHMAAPFFFPAVFSRGHEFQRSLPNVARL